MVKAGIFKINSIQTRKKGIIVLKENLLHHVFLAGCEWIALIE